MKQRITKIDLWDLPLKPKKILRKWALKKDKSLEWPNSIVWETADGVTLPLLTIGQMIEFLGDDTKFDLQTSPFGLQIYNQTFKHGEINRRTAKDLCDALWEAVKEVLNYE